MTIDDLRKDLQATEAKAVGDMRLEEAKLRDSGLKKTRSALTRLRVWLWIELAMNAVAPLLLGSFMAAHTEARFLVPALVLHVAAIAWLVFGARQLAALARVNLAGSVVQVQTTLESLRVERIRMTKWTILVAPLLWVPLLVVALEGCLGIDAWATLDHAWLVTNALFGVAFVPVMLVVAKRFGDRFGGSPVWQRILRDLGGYNLAVARGFIDELQRFER